MYSEYFKVQEECEKKYGDNTVVFWNNGTFYDVYQISKPDGTIIGKAYEISRFTGFKFTQTNNNKEHSEKNPHLVGCPAASISRVSELLEDKGYTIVRVDQLNSHKNGNKEAIQRKITYITNKGVSLNDDKPTNNVICLYIQGEKVDLGDINNLVAFGISSIDVSTGKSIIHEIQALAYNPSFSILECYKFLLHNRPYEIIIYLENIPDSYYEYLYNQLELDKYLLRFIRVSALKTSHTAFNDYNYREQLFKKFFTSSPGSSVEIPKDIVTDLGLDQFSYGVISYTLLLDYCYSINEKLLLNIHIPKVYNHDTGKLALTYNAALQLHLIAPCPTSRSRGIGRKKNKAKPESIIQVVDFTSTPMGYRYLYERLLNPLNKSESLQRYYTLTEKLETASTQPVSPGSTAGGKKENIYSAGRVDDITKLLETLDDVEKLHRKYILGLISASELSKMLNSYNVFISITNIFDFGLPALNVKQCADLMAYYAQWVDLQKLEDYNEDTPTNFIQPNRDISLDSLFSEYNACITYLHGLADFYSKLATKGSRVDVVYNPSDSNINTTLTRANAILAHLGANSGIRIVSLGANKAEITSDQIDQIHAKVVENKRMIINTLNLYISKIKDDLSKYAFHHQIHHHLAEIDFICNNVNIMKKYKYYIPTLYTQGGNARFKMCDIRHPLVERRIEMPYVTNNVTLGFDTFSTSNSEKTCTHRGMLIYGASTSGKSTLMKAIGCIIVMAQAGMPVPAKLEYTPFTQLFTRITCSDELLRGWSSYELEIRELNTILKFADSNSLVLADELSRGNSIDAGTAMVIATIEELMKRDTLFISSSHLHHLVEHPIIYLLEQKQKLRICHLTSQFINGRLVLDRKLKDGKGDGSYGIEVARSLGLSKEFMDAAERIKNEISFSKLSIESPTAMHSTKTSRYNSKVFVDHCILCNSYIDLEVHHLQEQRLADEKGMIGNTHKNIKGNLVVLCHKCHLNAAKLKWVNTVRGMELILGE